jgi:hypothetical protein
MQRVSSIHGMFLNKCFLNFYIEEHLQKTMVELLLNLLEENPDGYELRIESVKVVETVLKEGGGFPAEIRDFMGALVLPPEPMDPKVLAEIQRKQDEADALEAEKLRKLEEAEMAKNAPKNNPKIELILSDSRRGSLGGSRPGSRRGSGSSITLGGVERRGSYYSEDVSKKATVAMVVDDPEAKDKIANYDEKPAGRDLLPTSI